MIVIIGTPIDEKVLEIKNYRPTVFTQNLPIRSKQDPDPLLSNHVSVPGEGCFLLYTGIDDKKIHYVDGRKKLGIIGFFTDLKLAQRIALLADIAILEIPEMQFWSVRIENNEIKIVVGKLK